MMDWIYRREEDMPSNKQINYAKAISKELGIDLPQEFSRLAYSEFISENQNKMKRKRQSYMSEYNWVDDDGFDWYNEFMNG